MHRPTLALVALMVAFMSHVEVAVADDGDDPLCSTPRAAVAQLLEHLSDDVWSPTDAARCFERPPGVLESSLGERAVQLKASLEARGLYIVLEDVPGEIDFRDALGRGRALVVDGATEVFVVRYKTGWRFPTSVVQRIPRMYASTHSGLIQRLVQALPPVFMRELFGVTLWQISALCALLSLGWAIGLIVRGVLSQRLSALLSGWGVDIQTTFLATTTRPMSRLVAALIVLAGLPQLQLQTPTARVLLLVVSALAAVSGVIVAYRSVEVFSLFLTRRSAATASKMDDQLVVVVRKTLQVAVVTIGVVFVLQNMNVDVAGLLAGLGLSGLAFALAAKDTLANLFGSATLFLDHPFHVGDHVVAGGTEGTVLEIGLRSTRLRTPSGSLITVPNSNLAMSNIENLTLRSGRRFRVSLGLPHSAPPSVVVEFIEAVRDLISRHPLTRDAAIEVCLNDFTDTSQVIFVQTFLETDSPSVELKIRNDLLLDMRRLADERGLTLAHPIKGLAPPST